MPFQSDEEAPQLRLVQTIKPILRGYLEYTATVPVIDTPSEPLLMAFIAIADTRNVLAKENHGFGYHYHYCDKKGRRSDTMLSFDTSQPKVKLNGKTIIQRERCPLFWERHAEKNAKFLAKADQWGREKRVSVYTAAKPDLARKGTLLESFRRPSKIAQAVWPESAVLSV